MITNECIEVACEELRKAGFKPVVKAAGKHAAVTWISGGTERAYHTALTPSDHRAPLNTRSDIRRVLRNDGSIATEAPIVAGDRPRLFLCDGAFHCNSRDLAVHFGKQHKDVLRSIDRISSDLGLEFTQRNFAPSEYIDQTGRKLRQHNLSRDGFVLLAMGFTGTDAMAWKVLYLEAFNAMESELRQVATSAASPDVVARIERLEGDLAALIDLSLSAPLPEPGFVIVKAYKRRARRSA